MEAFRGSPSSSGRGTSASSRPATTDANFGRSEASASVQPRRSIQTDYISSRTAACQASSVSCASHCAEYCSSSGVKANSSRTLSHDSQCDVYQSRQSPQSV